MPGVGRQTWRYRQLEGSNSGRRPLVWASWQLLLGPVSKCETEAYPQTTFGPPSPVVNLDRCYPSSVSCTHCWRWQSSFQLYASLAVGCQAMTIFPPPLNVLCNLNVFPGLRFLKGILTTVGLTPPTGTFTDVWRIGPPLRSPRCTWTAGNGGGRERSISGGGPSAFSLSIHPQTSRHPKMQHFHSSSSYEYQQMPPPPPPPCPLDAMLLDGCISFMFGPDYAEHYLQCLLKHDPRVLTPHIFSSANGWPGSYFIWQATFPGFQPNAVSTEGHPLLLIDYKADLRQGRIVPQTLWTPHSRTDQRQYVDSAVLSLPIFFVHENGTVGLSVDDAAAGRCKSLRYATMPADMRGKASTHIRINWPGCLEWKRQFQTKDETQERNPITLERLVRHVGRSIDYFLQQHKEDPRRLNPHWRIGHGGITKGNINILGVCHVSSGSWMPILQVWPPVVDVQMPTLAFET